MGFHKTGCLICGKNLKYFDPPQTLKCEICGKEFKSDVSCEHRHFVCDQCHAQPGYESITRLALATGSDDPAAIAREMMESEFVNMHGPEHHYLVVAALLAAYKNAGGRFGSNPAEPVDHNNRPDRAAPLRGNAGGVVDLEKALALARQRAEKVPGGVCGNWGACGAGIGTGIFVSLTTGATPMSAGEWSLANEMTSLSLGVIARNGGPRCCKRDTYLAVLTAADFAGERLGVKMARPKAPQCSFFNNNPSCKRDDCLFYPSAGAAAR